MPNGSATQVGSAPGDLGVADFKAAFTRWRRILVWGVGVPIFAFVWWPVIEDLMPRENVTAVVMLSSTLMLWMLARTISQVFEGFVQTDQGLAGQAAALSAFRSPVGGKTDRRPTGAVGGDLPVMFRSPTESGGIPRQHPASDGDDHFLKK